MNWSLPQQKMYRAQLALMAEHLGIDDATRRDILHRVTGQRSTTEIDRESMTRVINEQRRLLREAGVRMPWSRTRAKLKWNQDDYIANLVMRLGWTAQPARLVGFIERMTRGWKCGVMTLTPREKSRLIVALRTLLGDQADGRAARERTRPDKRRPPAGGLRYVPGGLAK